MLNENLNRLNKKYIDLLFRMQSNSLCKANVGDYLVYKKDWLFNHLEQEFELQRSMKEIKEQKSKDERFLCMSCKNRSECPIYDIYDDVIKEYINKNPNNDIKCYNYEREK